MKRNSVALSLLIACLFVIQYSFSQEISTAFDELIQSEYKADQPGATVLLAKNGRVVYRKAFGMADLELGVPMKPEMVFEIGSMTKQFTAVSILMLEEQGKLSLEDDITKYIPDYPTQGKKITIHHLLIHTSGIKSYTSMAEWLPVLRKDFQPLELIDLFKDQPMDFDPGEKFLYNNSAYFILGYIIEKASGQTYQDFIANNIFIPLQMNNSYYGSHERIIPYRASGYQEDNDGFINAEYLSLTQPYAAGSIMSNVDDLLTWQKAIETNKLVSAATIQKAFTDHTLNNGQPTHYGYGWFLNEINGSPTIEHGGGIFGYTTNGIWLPKDNIYLVMLTNRDDKSPMEISTKLAAIAIGKPYDDNMEAFPVKPNILQSYTGVYAFEDGATRNIMFEEGTLFSQRTGSQRMELIPVSETKFRFKDSFSTIEFTPEDNGNLAATFTNRIEKYKGHKTDQKLPERQAITMEPSQMEKFAGIYDLQPGFAITVTLEDGHMMVQATGQEKFEVFPESPVKFFLTVVDAQVEFFSNDAGQVEYMILYQGGQELKCIRRP
jgi:CubicO group peptidase (beta-lactamase class C family)